MFQVDFNKPCHVHFMGIGGISMSGLAQVLLNAGFTISGSDIMPSETASLLSNAGINVIYKQVKENITPDIDLLVYTAAISQDNEELAEARRLGIPTLTRAELLGEIMANYKYGIAVAGTHGKTTTTAMMSHILLQAEKDPTISIGGLLDAIDNSNIRVGNSDYFVTEACEYTNSYHSLTPFVSIILNVDADHLDFFGNIENIAESFTVFAKKTAKDGLLIINGDMKYYDQITEGLECNIVSFGFNDNNKYQARNVVLSDEGCASYDLYVDGKYVDHISLLSTGEHNAMNSLSAIAAADFLGISLSDTKTGLLHCSSAKRRFEYKGRMKNGTVIIDDYAHHPTEIAATIKVANSIKKGKLYVVFQAHTFSRVHDLLDEFADALSGADCALLADIFNDREIDTGLVSAKQITDKINENGGNSVYLGDFESIENFVKNNCSQNDMFITLGSKNIGIVGEHLLEE